MAASYARRQQLRQLKRAALHASRASMTLAGAVFVGSCAGMKLLTGWSKTTTAMSCG